MDRRVDEGSGLRQLLQRILLLLIVAQVTAEKSFGRSRHNNTRSRFQDGHQTTGLGDGSKDILRRILYEQSWIRPRDQSTAYACEGTPLRISCDKSKGEVIRIIRANYGRFSITICNPHGVTEGWNLQCMSLRSLTIVSERCDGWTKCKVLTDNNLFGDPCNNTFKYLEVQYRCAKEPVPSTRRPTRPPTTTNVVTTAAPTTTPPPPTTTSTPAPPPTTPAPAPTTAQTDPTTNVGQSSTGNTTSTKIPTTQPPQTRTTTPQPNVTKTPVSPGDPFSHSDGPLPIKLVYCKGAFRAGLDWPTTKVGNTNVLKCPGELVGMVIWECGPQGWIGEPRDDCKSPWLKDIMQEVEESQPVEVIMKKIEVFTATKVLRPGDLKITASILTNLVEQLQEDLMDTDNPAEKMDMAEKVNNAMVQSASNLLSVKQRDCWENLAGTERTKVATSIVITVEETTFTVANMVPISGQVAEVDENILVEVNVIKVSDQTGDLRLPSIPMGDHSAWKDNTDSITIPRESLIQHSQGGKVAVVFIAYNNLGEWMNAESGASKPATNGHSNNNNRGHITDSDVREKTEDIDNTPQWVVNTKILSTSLNSRSGVVPLAQPITFVLQHINASINLDPKCSYWNYSDSTNLGHWADAGCRLVISNDTHTTCECDHLTSFAVLMDVAGTRLPSHHEIPLQVITYAGCLISILCLLLSFLTFWMFKNLQCDRNTIHKNLVLCLMIAETIFLVGIQQYEQPILCAVIAGLLHFFFLASFAWMCLEGIQLYVMLIEVFEAERSRVKWYYLFGYGVPALIVGVAAAVDHEGYGTERHCWLRTDTYFIWSFVGPVAAVITINIVMLSIAVYMMCRHATTAPSIKSTDKPKMEKYSSQDMESGVISRPAALYGCDPKVKRVSDVPEYSCGSTDHLQPSTSANSMKMGGKLAWIKGAAVLVVLLGLTWSFGILYINEHTVIMAYLFTILNSLQGLFIFVFHCLMNEKVQKEYRKVARRTSWLPDCIRVNYGGYTGYSQSTTPNQSTSSGNNYFSKLWSGRKRKKSTSSLLGKSNSSPSRRRRSNRPDSGSRDSSSVLTPLSNQNGFIYSGQQNGHVKQPYHGGINGDLSVVDCSVVDSEFVSEYCKENMQAHRDTPERDAHDPRDIYNPDASIYHVYEEPNFRNKKSLSTSDESIVKKRLSLISADTSDGIHYSEVSDEELFRMTEKEKRMSAYEREPLVFPSKSEDQLINSNGGGYNRSSSGSGELEARSPSLTDLSPDKEGEDRNLSTPNLKYKETLSRRDVERGRDNPEVSDPLLQSQTSMPNLSAVVEETEGELAFGSFDTGNSPGHNGRKDPSLTGRKVKRLSSDVKTKHDPHRFRLSNTSSDC